MSYQRHNTVAQLPAKTLYAIYDQVERIADRLNIDRHDASEIAGRVLDMVEVGAERLGSICPDCGVVATKRVPDFRTGGLVSHPACEEHGAFSGKLAISFPFPDDMYVPPLPEQRP